MIFQLLVPSPGMDLEAEIDTCYDSFVEAGGTMGEWNDLFLRSDLDAEELERVEAGEPREKYQHLVESVLSTGDLILYDVLDQDCHVTGTALGRVLEVMKTSKGEGLLKLWFVDSQDDQYRKLGPRGLQRKAGFPVAPLCWCRWGLQVQDQKQKDWLGPYRWMEALQLQECLSNRLVRPRGNHRVQVYVGEMAVPEWKDAQRPPGSAGAEEK